jgi:adenosylhomocysteine nucleosidase
LVLSAGFSGALQPEHGVGDLILAAEVVDQAGGCWKTNHPKEFSAEVSLPSGRLLAVTRLVRDPAEKRRLGRQFAAVAADMETATVARLCREHGVPFACLRVISDDLGTSLSPQLVELLNGGRISVGEVLRAVVRRPGLVREMAQLARQTRRAARQLLALRPLISISTR